MANQQLIKGAAFAADKFVKQGKSVGNGNTGNSAAAAQLANKAARRSREAQTSTYIDKISKSGVPNLKKLPNEWRATLTKHFQAEKKEYANIARRISSLPKGSEAYQESKADMERISANFVSINESLSQHKENKEQYLKDHDNGSISEGVSDSDHNYLSQLYGSDSQSISVENGVISILSEDGGSRDLSDSPEYFNKSFKLANQLSKTSEGIYGAGEVMNQYSQDQLRNQLYMTFNNATKEELLSQATDDFWGRGNSFEGALEQEGVDLQSMSIADLRKRMTDFQMNILMDVSKQGAAFANKGKVDPKTAKTNPGTNGNNADTEGGDSNTEGNSTPKSKGGPGYPMGVDFKAEDVITKSKMVADAINNAENLVKGLESVKVDRRNGFLENILNTTGGESGGSKKNVKEALGEARISLIPEGEHLIEIEMPGRFNQPFDVSNEAGRRALQERLQKLMQQHLIEARKTKPAPRKLDFPTGRKL